MVSFSCNNCQDTVKKPKLDQHAQRCRGASFVCLDCSKEFRNANEWRHHTSCITEAEKVERSVFTGKRMLPTPATSPMKDVQVQNTPAAVTAPPSIVAQLEEKCDSKSNAAPVNDKKRKREEMENSAKKEKKERKEKKKKEKSDEVMSDDEKVNEKVETTVEKLEEKSETKEEAIVAPTQEKSANETPKKEKKEKKLPQMNQDLLTAIQSVPTQNAMTLKSFAKTVTGALKKSMKNKSKAASRIKKELKVRFVNGQWIISA